MCIFTVSKKRSNFFLELRFATTRAACKITSRSKSNETPPKDNDLPSFTKAQST